jgi:3-phenylpropionate/trans-cinnamate dioxygenase ferredoxin reductase component
MRHTYVIVGGGLAGASAIEGIRQHDPDGSILMLARENYAPYQRPPLSKDLWFGRATLDELSVYPDAFYREHGVELLLRREAIELDPARHLVWDERGVEHGYGHLLLATGGRPRRLAMPGAEIDGLHYFRNLEDYVYLSRRLDRFEHVLVVGGGFIGVELAAALRQAGKEVTLLVDREYPLFRVLPRELGLAVAERYRSEGIETVSEDKLVALEESQGLIRAHTAGGGVISTQTVLVGIGIEPDVDLAEAAGLDVDDGIVVDEFARTTDPDIYAAGDVARYPCVPLGHNLRVEHWDHAREHGRCAGANLAGATEAYEGIPYFFSDLFDLGIEGVGDLDPSLRVEMVWREESPSAPGSAGVVFYVRDDVTRGVLLWNVRDAVDWARALVRAGRPRSGAERAASVPWAAGA